MPRKKAKPDTTELVRERLIGALNPNAVKVSPVFHALLAVLLGQSGWTKPSLQSFVITSDDFIIAQREGDVGFNDFLGSAADLRNNIIGVCEFCKISDRDRDWLLAEVGNRKA